MRKLIICILTLLAFGISDQLLFAEQTLVAKQVEEAPIIDGKAEDLAWNEAEVVITHDKVADIDLALKAVYTEKEIFFLVRFPDPDESRTHKSWVWDKGSEIYRSGNDREDVFVFKWSMEAEDVDLSIYADNSYQADIWFWKACRTDPRGFADDKFEVLGPLEIEDSNRLTSRTGKTMYLLRKGDMGRSVFETELPVEYKGDVLVRFTYQQPTESRADVKAKGTWKDGEWTIEFARTLNTGYKDDVQFDISKRYQFGISRYEIAGRASDPELTQPLYGSGDVSGKLILAFQNKSLTFKKFNKGDKFIIALIPEKNVFDQRKRYKYITTYLSEKLNLDVRAETLSSYGEICDAFLRGEVDGGFFGSLSYALTHIKAGVQSLARPVLPNGSSTYSGYIFVRKDSGITHVEDMKGKSLALVHKATTAGYLFPLAYFKEQGIENLEEYFSKIYFSGSHDASAWAVYIGEADIGAGKNHIFNELVEEYPDFKEQMVILAESGEVPSNGFAVRQDLDPALKSTLKDLLLNMDKTEEGRLVLEQFGAIKFIETKDQDYAPVYQMAEKLGIDLGSYPYKD